MTQNLRRDDLQCAGLFLWQDQNAFCFGMDAVLLADAARVFPGDAVADLCAGNGVVSLLLAGKTKADHITALEIQPEAAALAGRNIRENGLSSRVSVVLGDVKEAQHLLGREGFDVVVCNPPYLRPGVGKDSKNPAQRIARQEVLCTLADIARAAASILRFGGRLFLVHRPQRLADVVCELRQAGLEPKRLRFVRLQGKRPPCLFLIEAQKGAAAGLMVQPDLLLQDEMGNESAELRRIYGRESQ